MIHLQHIGIPVESLENTIQWYKAYMGANVLNRCVLANGIRVAFLDLNGTVLELYEFLPGTADAQRVHDAPGRVDHLAFDVEDIESAFATAKAEGLHILEGITYLPECWERGCRYFMVLSASGEKVEFNQIL